MVRKFIIYCLGSEIKEEGRGYICNMYREGVKSRRKEGVIQGVTAGKDQTSGGCSLC